MRIPAIISNGMILEKNAKLWGQAGIGESIRVTFMEKEYLTEADETGRWEVRITADQFGGPHVLKIGERIIRDVMIGYVWICGGQSNMELPMARVKRMFADELKDANYPDIRAFTVPKAYDFNNELQLYETGDFCWKAATRENIDSFFATAYFFARKIWERFKIPVGLICSAAGGSTAEAWISEEALQAFPKHAAALRECKDTEFVKKTEYLDLENTRTWHEKLDETDAGLREHWESEAYDDSSWSERELTESWEYDLNQNGAVWFRKEIDIPHEIVGEVTLLLGRVVDSNYVYVNGKFVGRIEYKYPPSIFKLPEDTLRKGRNVIAVRVISHNGLGGFVKDKPYKLEAEFKPGGGDIRLDGLWKFKVGGVMPQMPETTFFYRKPAGLYNAMLSPVIGYSVTGAVWYQGESNTASPEDYKELMSTFIKEIRSKWNKDFPFIFTQLVNFEEAPATIAGSNWALIREQQLLCLDIPGTAMAVGIDCGEYNDLHPLDKRTIGERLALAAFKLAYGEDIIYSGPIIRKASFCGDVITVCFDHADTGLTTAGGTLTGFEIVSESGEVQKVKAEIDGSTVIIKPGCNSSRPHLIRYAWADNPEASLYNSEGLPASPFRVRVD